MSDKVDPAKIEDIVGAVRHQDRHIGRAVSATQTMFILHSESCLETSYDLRSCLFSVAMDRGIEPDGPDWKDNLDKPVYLAYTGTRLRPDGDVLVFKDSLEQELIDAQWCNVGSGGAGFFWGSHGCTIGDHGTGDKHLHKCTNSVYNDNGDKIGSELCSTYDDRTHVVVFNHGSSGEPEQLGEPMAWHPHGWWQGGEDKL